MVDGRVQVHDLDSVPGNVGQPLATVPQPVLNGEGPIPARTDAHHVIVVRRQVEDHVPGLGARDRRHDRSRHTPHTQPQLLRRDAAREDHAMPPVVLIRKPLNAATHDAHPSHRHKLRPHARLSDHPSQGH